MSWEGKISGLDSGAKKWLQIWQHAAEMGMHSHMCICAKILQSHLMDLLR